MNWYIKSSCSILDRAFESKLQKTAISQQILKGLRNIERPQDLPFDNIFKGQYRIIIPLYNEKLREMIELLESGATSSKSRYRVDIKNKTAYKQGNKNAIRLCKVVSNELGKEWGDECSRQVASPSDSQAEYSIIISRHPIDIVRMSDHSEITSCHAPGRDYFSCAVQEAADGGPIAYVVDSNSLADIQDTLQEDDVFEDKDRGVKGVIPVSRIRINRYSHSSEDFEIAVPTNRVYGRSIAGFKDSVDSWAKRSQVDVQDLVMSDKDLTHYYRHGGAYADTPIDSHLFNRMYGVNDFHGSCKYTNEGGAEALAAMWHNEISATLEKAQELKYIYLGAEIYQDGDGDGGVSLITQGSISFKFYNIDFDYEHGDYFKIYAIISEEIEKISDNEEKNKAQELRKSSLYSKTFYDFMKGVQATCPSLWKKIKKYEKIAYESNILQQIKTTADNSLNFAHCRDLEIVKNNNEFIIVIDLELFDADNPDDFEYAVNEALEFEEEGYKSLYKKIYSILEDNYKVQLGEYHDFMEQNKFTNLMSDYDDDENEYSLSTKHFDIPINTAGYYVKSGNLASIQTEVNELILDFVESYIQNTRSKQGYLFPAIEPSFNRSDVPRAIVTLTEDDYMGRKYTQFDIKYHFNPAANQFAGIQETPRLNYSTKALFKVLDTYHDSFIRYLSQRIPSIIKKYQVPIRPEQVLKNNQSERTAPPLNEL